MVDNRSAGYYGIAGAFNFKSGDISGTAASLQDDTMGQGNEYYKQNKKEDEANRINSSEMFTDRSAQLRATLNSLAMLNVAGVINSKKRPKRLDNSLDDDFDEHDFALETKKRKKKLLLENQFTDEVDDELFDE